MAAMNLRVGWGGWLEQRQGLWEHETLPADAVYKNQKRNGREEWLQVADGRYRRGANRGSQQHELWRSADRTGDSDMSRDARPSCLLSELGEEESGFLADDGDDDDDSLG
ncbi:hypothetical protein V497_07919 [Pseudogymnoascus sp. VKM F-4516 (FW-969)]|nr:hypothetical protein V497_07919 [Pseudogymnoascus sp. VKM F-4516 (FW-969)]